MKTCRTPSTIVLLHAVVFSVCFFGLSIGLEAVAAPAPGEPAEREVIGTQSGLEEKNKAPAGMALVPAGKVQVGLDSKKVLELAGGQKNRLDIFARSVPKHTVKVEAFFCDLYEVTNAQWKHYLKITGQQPSEYLKEFGWGGNDTYPEREAHFPVRNITYREASNFARWCGKRIPTETEWLRAASGDEERIYAWGDDWNRGKNCTNRRNSLSPVGSYPEGLSPFGIYDMTGSLWEWTSSKFQAFPKYKPPSINIGKKKVEALPGFNAQMYVIKGGHFLAGEVANRLDVREATLPSNSLDSLGFRCIKDEIPGMTQFKYATRNLEGSVISEFKCDMKNLYAIEITDYTDSEPPLINGYDCMMIAPSEKIKTTSAKIIKESPDKPRPIGILSLNRVLEEPNLPPGSYIIAYRHQGLSEEDKKSEQKLEADKKRKEQIAKIEEELKKRAEERERLQKERGISISKAEVELDAEELKKLEEIKKQDEEDARIEAERMAQLEKMGLVSSAKEHVDFPRNKNLIVFMNSNDVIVGYLEVLGIHEDTGPTANTVFHNPETGMTDIEISIGVLPSKIAQFKFSIKITDNPF